MQALAEHFGGRVLLFGVFGKNRRAGESEDLQVREKPDDILMALAEMAAMPLVENHYNFLIPNVL